MLGKDKTREIEVLLMDRPARKLSQKTVVELEAEVYSFKNTKHLLKIAVTDLQYMYSCPGEGRSPITIQDNGKGRIYNQTSDQGIQYQ